ncbi:hypothetical protein [Luteolibacter marinus]|uniref:hypothetical protein n=1 Tax=Luteolibacter marinus TaxID=2776705 RepID=UPI001866EBA6|nr:hypothetical protein [Luteolibacter marinus]
MWECDYCQAVVEDDDWSDCWSCARTRGPGDGRASQEIREMHALRESLKRCMRCTGTMKFHGFRELHHGYAQSLFSEHNGYEKERLVLYACDRCGKVEFFLPEVGQFLRGDPPAADD